MRRLLAALAAGAFLVTVSACGSSGDSTGSDKASSGGTTKVKVGVIVNHNTDSPYSATFEVFSITPAAGAKM